MTLSRLAILLPIAALGACETVKLPVESSSPLFDATGRTIGTLTAFQSPGGVTLTVRAGGLPRGVHGIHVHTTGRCDTPDFTSAGGHWNPANRKHGAMNPMGPHRGDMGNVTAAANGALDATLVVPGARLEAMPGDPMALLDADGAAVVIHAGADDNMTDPSGNSGARIACAVIQPRAVPAR